MRTRREPDHRAVPPGAPGPDAASAGRGAGDGGPPDDHGPQPGTPAHRAGRRPNPRPALRRLGAAPPRRPRRRPPAGGVSTGAGGTSPGPPPDSPCRPFPAGPGTPAPPRPLPVRSDA
ncbi:hypothetical protein B1H20_18870 [Streptomyces violaceoruber]|uniref:Uncharacterized protein n=1 Tax=Streptomyces violaceoruber TaxID=1935 RepID=A0A1V0UD97_STRVN|nr:hypothetical protein B1H20_18870 [Streptomyces violaceoruber]